MKKIVLQAVLFSTLFTNISFAHNVQLNQPLPAVSVSQDGEIVLQNKSVHYKNWHSANLVGKVRVVFHIAGRSTVKEKNEALMDAIKKAGFERSRYQTTTIINADDAVIGTGLFVKNSAEDGKLDNAHSQVVLDQKSSVKNTWKLKEKESFVTVLDKQGKVHFVNEGKLSPQQIQQVLDLVHSLLKK